MADQKEIEQLQKRLKELADRSYQNNQYTFTAFLGMSEQQVYYDLQRELQYAGPVLTGGCMLSERKVIRFGKPDLLGYEEEFPIVCMSIVPNTPKFAENLTHRDFLGALMNLGIERNRIGDIFVQEKQAIMFCLENVTDFIIENLGQVRHTKVHCNVIETPESLQAPEPEEVSVSVASVRIDGVVSKLYNISRNASIELFRGGRVFVNGKLVENNSYALKENDAITVRGFGKFIYSGSVGETKKGKERILLKVFR